MTNEPDTGRAVARSKPSGVPDLRSHLQVERLLREMGSVDWRNAVVMIRSVDFLRSDPRAIDGARRDLEAAPSVHALERLMDALERAMTTQPSLAVTSMAVAVLFDARVRQPANPEAYINALCFDLVDLGFQPAVVAKACQDLRRTSTYIPEIPEVIEACRKVQSNYEATARLSRRAIDARYELEHSLETAVACGPIQPPSQRNVRRESPPHAQRESPDWNPDA